MPIIHSHAKQRSDAMPSKTRQPESDIRHLYQAAVVMGIFAANCGPIRDAAEGSQPEYELALRSASRMARDMAAEMLRRDAE